PLPPGCRSAARQSPALPPAVPAAAPLPHGCRRRCRSAARLPPRQESLPSALPPTHRQRCRKTAIQAAARQSRASPRQSDPGPTAPTGRTSPRPADPGAASLPPRSAGTPPGPAPARPLPFVLPSSLPVPLLVPLGVLVHLHVRLVQLNN